LGNRWRAWQDDFFDPAQPLLQAAPWIFVRGNHEGCGRQAEGWARLLSPFSEDTLSCEEQEPSAAYPLQFGDLNLVVVDNSAARNPEPLVGQNTLPQTLATANGSHTWILSHRPLHKLGAPGFDKAKVDLILSGHVHDFVAYTLGPDSNPVGQLVVGNSGTELEGDPGYALSGVNSPTVVAKHGFLLISRDDDKWTATLFGVDDRVLAECVIKNLPVRCNALTAH
jgi:hypothetical protein